jgi:drug/metabolite transporter (DMT)-like permease
MSRRAWLAFAAISLIWGVPYLLIRIAVRDGVTPPALAWGRLTLAAIVLLALAARAGTLGQLRGRWRWLLAYALAEVTIPFPMLAFGEQRVPSSLAAIVVASVPLIGAVLAMRFDHTEKPTPVRALGLVLGFGGVVALVGLDVAGRSQELIGTGAVLLVAVGYAIGPMIIKHRLTGLDPRAAIGAGVAIAAVLLTPIAVIDHPRSVPGVGAISAVVVLGLLCTAVAFVIFTVLIREAGTSRATVITYVNPVIAVALGVSLLGERPGAGAVAGLLLILAGSWLSTDSRLPPGLAEWAARRARRGLRPSQDERLRNLDENDRVEREQHREQDRPAVQVAFDQRATAERSRAGADAERTREARVLARVHQHQEHQHDGQKHLDYSEHRGHGLDRIGKRADAADDPSGTRSRTPSIEWRISIASARSSASTAS